MRVSGGRCCLMVPCRCGLSPLLLQASICRSSQPLSGFSARCLEDEQMLQAIRKANPGSDFIYVVDTRPKVSCHPVMSGSAALSHGAGARAELTGLPSSLVRGGSLSGQSPCGLLGCFLASLGTCSPETGALDTPALCQAHCVT